MRVQVEALVADIREALAKVNDTPYDETAHAQIPTVQYEVCVCQSHFRCQHVMLQARAPARTR